MIRKYLALLFFSSIINYLTAQNYSFAPNVKVNDDPAGQAFHSVYSSGMHSMAARGDTVYIAYRGDQTPLATIYFSKSTDAGLTWSPGRRVSYPEQGILQALAVDSKGDIFITYTHIRDPNYRNIHFTKSTDGGLTFTYPITVEDDSLPNQMKSSIAVDTSGQKIVIAWMDYRNWYSVHGNVDIYCTRSSDGGSTFGPNVRVDDTGSDTIWQSNPCITMDLSGDNVYISWQDERNWTKDYDIYFARSTNGGNSFLPNILVNDTATTGNTAQWSPSIALDTLGRIYIAWEDQRTGNSGNYLSRSDDGGLTFGPNIKITDRNMNTDPPSIAVDDSNGVYVAWGSDLRVYGYRVFFAYSNSAGDSFFPNVRVDDYSPDSDVWCWYANIAINKSKKAFIAWDDDRNDPSHNNSDIYFTSGSYVGIEETGRSWCDYQLIRCFPNPFIHQIKIRLLSSDIKIVSIYDCLGRLIRNYNIENNQKESLSTICWDGDNQDGLPVPIGSYFIVINNGKGIETYKIIKIK